ncbi:hypothetical protein BH10PSE17_BH10PSE17_26820 [soil metagenome]
MRINELAGDWQEVSALLDEALALPETERIAWLDRLVGDASRHRAKLSVLLAAAADVETGDFLDTLPPVDTSSEGDASRLRGGDTVGPYTLIVSIGQGGMGAVWLASRTDGKPTRKVALKLPYASWDPRLSSRLELERDIVAALDHTHIARLYDAGIDSLGRPWLALEYVEGKPIDLYADDAGLDIRQRLELILQVASAVTHAHSRLVIHGDLKPPNILVTREGQVRLLDFGLGRLLDPEATQALTREFGRGLTPAYASPEQALCEAIGTPTDVYSLGVVTYELLTGVRPAISGPIAAPSHATSDPRLRRVLRGDLDAILLRALRETAAERYVTVDAFAADIRRYLDGDPVAAQPDALAYRLRKFVTRHRAPVAFGAVAALALIVGTGVSAWQTHVARLETQRADEVKQFTLSIIRDADTDSGAGAGTTAADLLSIASKRIETELGSRPDVQAELMTAIAFGLIGQNKNEEAVPASQKAVEYAARSLGDRSATFLSARLVQIEALIEAGHSDQAKPLVEPAIDLARQLDRPLLEAQAMRLQSQVEAAIGTPAEAVAIARKIVDVVRRVTPHSRQDRIDIAESYIALAQTLSWSNGTGQADAARQALAKIDEVTDPPLISQRLTARGLLGEGLTHEGHVVEGLAELQASYEGLRDYYGPTHHLTSVAASNLGLARIAAGDAEGAIEAQLAASLALPSIADVNQRATVRTSLAAAYSLAGKPAEALKILNEVAHDLEAAGATNLSMYWRVKLGQASAALRSGNLDEAARSLDIAMQAKVSPHDDAFRQLRLSELRTAQKRHEEAIALATGAAKTLADYPILVVRAQAEMRLGAALLAAGRAAESIAPLEHASEVMHGAQTFESKDAKAVNALLAQARQAAGTR